MRGGPELRFFGSVTTVNADTSVVITQDRDQSQDRELQTAARVVTLTDTDTADAVTLDRWRTGEKVEVIVRSLDG